MTLTAQSSMTRELPRGLVIATISFLTLVDLFAAQAILPSLARAYNASPAEIGVAVNASTFGMAAAGIVVALLARRIDRRNGIWISLALLSIPTFLLSSMPNLTVFTALRVTQGIFMSAAFTLTMAYIAEHGSPSSTAGALAAYVTGNVGSNLFGRLMSAAIADHFGLSANFYAFAVLNLAGAALVFFSLNRMQPMCNLPTPDMAMSSWSQHLRDPALRAGFAIGFLVLFAFLGTYTYVNFVLAAEPIGLSPMALGFVYLVFLPSIVTTPLAGRIVRRFGPGATISGSLILALAGAAPLLIANLAAVIVGLVLIGVGTFLAQAAATGYISVKATHDRASASGMYLASYYLGGLTGSALLGALFNMYGWSACVAGIAAALVAAAGLALRLTVSKAG